MERRDFLKTVGLGIAAALLTKDALAEAGPETPIQKAIHGCNRKTYLADISVLLSAQFPKNRIVNIVCHGHSVPSGYFATPVVDSMNAYPHLLQMHLKERYPYAVINVIVTAKGCEASKDGAERFETDVLTHRPDVVTIDYALNDRAIGLDAARQSWIAMIEKAKKQGVKILLMTPTPDKDHKQGDNDELLQKHAVQIRTLAAEYDVGIVDSLAAFEANTKDGKDVLSLLSNGYNHPNRAGHEIVVREVMKWFPGNDCVQ